MKKAGLAIVVLILLSVIGWPYIKGVFLQYEIKKSVRQINRNLSESDRQIAIEIQNYQVRYSKSQIEWTLEVPFLKLLTGTDRLVLINRVSHSYSNRVVSSTSLEKNAWYLKFLEKIPGGKEPLSIHTKYFFSGNIAVQADLEAVLLVHAGHMIQVKPARLNIKFDNHDQKIQSSFSGEGIAVAEIFDMKPFCVRSKIEQLQPFIRTWNSKIDIVGFSLDHNGRLTELNGFKGDCYLKINDKEAVVSMGLSAVLEDFSTNGFQAFQSSGRFQIDHLDAKGFEALAAVFAENSNLFLKQILSGGFDPEAAGLMTGWQLDRIKQDPISFYAQFLRKGMRARLSGFKIKTPQGEIKAELAVGLKKGITLAGLLPVMVQPSRITGMIFLTSNIQVPYTFLGYQPDLMRPLFDGMQTGLFVVKNENLVHQAQIKNDQIYLNQKEVVLP